MSYKLTLGMLLLFITSLSLASSSLNMIVYNAKTGEPIPGYTIILTSVNGHQLEKTDNSPEPLILELNNNDSYTIEVSNKGFISCSDSFFTDKKGTHWEKEFYLEPIMIICCITPPEIHYDLNSSDIRASEKENAAYLKELLTNNPSISIRVEGYRDAGEIEIISIQRASSLKNWLINNGIAESRMEVNDNGINYLTEKLYDIDYPTDHSEENLRIQELNRKAGISILRFLD